MFLPHKPFGDTFKTVGNTVQLCDTKHSGFDYGSHF